jgi:hypothetical protein
MPLLRSLRLVTPLCLLTAALLAGCKGGAKDDAVCDGTLQGDEQAAGGVDALWDQDDDGAFDAANAGCAAAYGASDLDCDDDDPTVHGGATEIACNGKDDDCDEATADVTDADADEVCDPLDACPGEDDRVDADDDGTPDGCDLCPDDPEDDGDGDGSCDSVDLCAGYDDNVDSDSDGKPDGCDPCVGDITAEGFSIDMTGCPATVTWADRATMCTPGYTPCTGQQWVDRRADIGPTHNYWTDDDLGYSGDEATCSAAVDAEYACEGEIKAPMRVCAGSTDALGNECNWTNCRWGDGVTNEFFGGCDGNNTAGTLCCR